MSDTRKDRVSTVMRKNEKEKKKKKKRNSKPKKEAMKVVKKGKIYGL